MIQEVLLNFFILIYLGLVFLENKFKPKGLTILKIRQYIHELSIQKSLAFFLPLIIIVLLLVLKGQQNPLLIYIYTAFSMIILFHATWLSGKMQLKYKTVVFLFAISIIFTRIYFPTIFSHNVFVLLVVLWFGPILTSFRFFSRKVFIIISLLWLIYDIFYIWITPAYQQISNTTQSLNFPLSIAIGDISIGLADLFYASLLVSVLQKTKYRLFAIVLLTVSNILLTSFVLDGTVFKIFPLLVIWVPCGLAVLILEHYFS